ncbi:zinc-finger domain-containing protein [Candidatus Saccharibacteria bacterium]|nr:zinc-finger domain-containing protein [Candidatus Saccharibacteria bacterium]MCB9817230.1 zinc-finger domain-containing protein [Candidatus Nomurabacteria bacterium]
MCNNASIIIDSTFKSYRITQAHHITIHYCINNCVVGYAIKIAIHQIVHN